MFMNSTDYPFTSMLEGNWRGIREELLKINPDNFMEWPQRFLYEAGWNVFGLYAAGKKLEENCSLCPKTTSAVESVPGLTTAGFSWMEPGTHIKPHVGYTNEVLRCHLGIIIPEDCQLRVGAEICSWSEGKTLVFDDTTEHEAWNNSETRRVVLLLDFTKTAQLPNPGALPSPPSAPKLYSRRSG